MRCAVRCRWRKRSRRRRSCPRRADKSWPEGPKLGCLKWMHCRLMGDDDGTQTAVSEVTLWLRRRLWTGERDSKGTAARRAAKGALLWPATMTVPRRLSQKWLYGCEDGCELLWFGGDCCEEGSEGRFAVTRRAIRMLTTRSRKIRTGGLRAWLVDGLWRRPTRRLTTRASGCETWRWLTWGLARRACGGQVTGKTWGMWRRLTDRSRTGFYFGTMPWIRNLQKKLRNEINKSKRGRNL